MARAGFVSRTGEQFHFVNEGYRDFDEFLAALASRKRKAIKRERREALGDDVTVELLTGTDIKPEHWDAFFAFYMDTGSRKWGRPYLTREFFDRVGATMAARILLVMAKRAGRHIAGAHQLHRRRRALRPQLGRDRGAPVPAFRGLLLPGDRIRDQARPEARRGRRARASTSWRAAIAGRDLFGA